MKVFIIVAILSIAAYASVTAMPEALYDGPIYELRAIADPIEDIDAKTNDDLQLVRQARVTCDLLSVQTTWVSVNHSACAAKCIAQRRKGGRCRDGVCVCR